MYGGLLRGVATLNISLDGSFTVYPPARLNNSLSSRNDFVMDSITILDGGVLKFMGTAEENNRLNVTLTGSLHIQGGGEFRTNNIYLQGQGQGIVEWKVIGYGGTDLWLNLYF